MSFDSDRAVNLSEISEINNSLIENESFLQNFHDLGSEETTERPFFTEEQRSEKAKTEIQRKYDLNQRKNVIVSFFFLK